MSHRKFLITAILALFVIGCAPPAEQPAEQEIPPPPPKAEPAAIDMSTVEAPSPGHENLGLWVGTWKGSGTLADNPMGPGGPMEWTDTCEWYGGAKFNVICKSEGTGPMGETMGMGISGYKPETDEYYHFGIDNTGWGGYAVGKREGDKYTFTSEEKMGDKTYYSRWWMEMEGDSRMTFAWEMSEDGENYTVMMEGTSEKL
jgi:hypothetical protein